MKITRMTNTKGKIDYGHAWRYFQMGFTDEYGNRNPAEERNWKFVNNEIKVIGDDGKDGMKFEYGEDKQAELYGWNYEELKKE